MQLRDLRELAPVTRWRLGGHAIDQREPSSRCSRRSPTDDLSGCGEPLHGRVSVPFGSTTMTAQVCSRQTPVTRGPRGSLDGFIETPRRFPRIHLAPGVGPIASDHEPIARQWDCTFAVTTYARRDGA